MPALYSYIYSVFWNSKSKVKDSDEQTAWLLPASVLPQDELRSVSKNRLASRLDVLKTSHKPYDLTFATLHHVVAALDEDSAMPISEQLHARLTNSELKAILDEVYVSTTQEDALNPARRNVGMRTVAVSERNRATRCARLCEEVREQHRLHAIALRDADCCDVDIIYRSNEYDPQEMLADVATLKEQVSLATTEDDTDFTDPTQHARIYHMYPWNERKREIRVSAIIAKAQLSEVFPNARCARLDILIKHNTRAATPVPCNTMTEAGAVTAKLSPRDEICAMQLKDENSWWKEDFSKRVTQLQPFIAWDFETRHRGTSVQSKQPLSLAKEGPARPTEPCPRIPSLSGTSITSADPCKQRRAYYSELCTAARYQNALSDLWDKIGDAYLLYRQIEVLVGIQQKASTNLSLWAQDHLGLYKDKRDDFVPSLRAAMANVAYRADVLRSKPEAEALRNARNIYKKLMIEDLGASDVYDDDDDDGDGDIKDDDDDDDDDATA
nr:hypothetical protein CFP56_22512 [Quercus suber]